MRPLVERMRRTVAFVAIVGGTPTTLLIAEAADEIERLRTAISTTLALAGCAHLADDHGHQRCGALAADHDGRRHPYTRPRMLDALAGVVGDNAR